MDDDERMAIDERRTYLKRMRRRYRTADRSGRGVLVSEMKAVTGLHRKSLLRLLHAPSLERQPRARQRGAELWTGSGAGGAGVGTPGLHLR